MDWKKSVESEKDEISKKKRENGEENYRYRSDNRFLRELLDLARAGEILREVQTQLWGGKGKIDFHSIKEAEVVDFKYGGTEEKLIYGPALPTIEEDHRPKDWIVIWVEKNENQCYLCALTLLNLSGLIFVNLPSNPSIDYLIRVSSTRSLELYKFKQKIKWSQFYPEFKGEELEETSLLRQWLVKQFAER